MRNKAATGMSQNVQRQRFGWAMGGGFSS